MAVVHGCFTEGEVFCFGPRATGEPYAVTEETRQVTCKMCRRVMPFLLAVMAEVKRERAQQREWARRRRQKAL